MCGGKSGEEEAPMTAALMKESGLSRGRRDAPLLINDRIRKEVCRKASDSPELHQREREEGGRERKGERKRVGEETEE